MTTQQNHRSRYRSGHSAGGPFGKILDEFMGTSFGEMLDSVLASTRPHANVLETESAYEIHIAAPGMNKNDFTIRVEDGMLHVSADVSQSATPAEYTSREFDYSRFSRGFRLSGKVDHQRISARYENGLLMITLPKYKQDRDKQEIRVD